MRLIDADAMLLRNKDSIYDTVDLKEMLDNEPTAYDVENVFEQIKSVSFERYGNAGMGGQMVVSFDDVVEILKGDSGNEIK